MTAIEQIVDIVRHGLRNVLFPSSAPLRVTVVVEYPNSIVRHEIVPERKEA